MDQMDSKDPTGSSDDSIDSGRSRSLWMVSTVIVVSIFVFYVSSTYVPALAILITPYAGYRTWKKSVPSQALGTGFYLLSIVSLLGLQFDSFIGYFFFGFVTKRYALWKHPPEVFRRPIGNAQGYYYNPTKINTLDRIVVSVVSFCLRGTIPVVGRAIGKRLLILTAGLEIEGSELKEDDLLYYLHRDSPGFVFQSDKYDAETTTDE